MEMLLQTNTEEVTNGLLIGTFPMTLSGLRCHSRLASFRKCDLSYDYAAMLTKRQLTVNLARYLCNKSA